jgi:AcrR family transcriptional regulator
MAKRKYELKVRAERQRETRRRIVEAAVELHGSVGPARTTVTEIAKRAGVERPTVYRHFPDDAALFDACSSHWAERNPLPATAPLPSIADPEERVRLALTALYDYYGGVEGMLSNVTRDAPLLPELAAVGERRRGYLAELERLLGAGWPPSGRKARRAMIALALDFPTWTLLRDRGLDNRAAAASMARAVASA